MTKTNWIATLILLAGCVETDAGKAQAEWAKSMDIKGPVVCSKQDSDADGFVFCTFKDERGVQAIECATGHGCAKGGCRVPKVRVQGSAAEEPR